jgi:uncharacterized protein YjbK
MGNSREDKEIELKLRLSSFTDYLKLLGFLGNPDSEHELLNCFFDTEDHLLRDAGWALRVRVCDAKGLVTVKGSSVAKGMAVVREEVEAEIGRGEALEIINLQRDVMELTVEPVVFIRDRFPEIQPARLIDFRTNRKLKSFRMGDGDYYLQIDQTYYRDGSVDYELEVELPDTEQIVVVENCLRKLFDHLDIPFQRQTESKLARSLRCAGLL